MNKKPSLVQRIILILESNRFFWAIIALFVLQALWIALTGRYPMAFDEDFHMGVIRLYVDHPIPFWAQHPAGADVFGAVTRDPSYLFHYLSSFVYRILGVFTNNQSTLVITLRLINIGLFAAGLVFWRKVLLKTKASKALVHFSLLMLIFVPVVTLTAAQVNYDNLLMLLAPIILLLAIDLSAGFKKQRFDVRIGLALLGLMLLTAIVKYAFLPILLGVSVYLALDVKKSFKNPRTILKKIQVDWVKIARAQKWLLIVFVLISGVLFSERYLINVVKYHHPIPDCGKVLTIEQCMKFGPWGRDYGYKQNPSINNKSIVAYSIDWAHGMWLRSFFAVDGPGTYFSNKAPLLLPGASSIALIAISLLTFIRFARPVWRRYNSSVLTLLSVVTVFYVVVLWGNGLRMFLEVGKSVAINGRYLIVVAPIMFLISALVANQLLNGHRNFKVIVAALAITCFVWGGGAATYILRSDPGWRWQNNQVQQLNDDFKKTFGPITPGYYKPNWFMKIR